VFLSIQILTPLFSQSVPNLVVYFRFLNRKFNENFKNVLKTIIFLLQVGFTGNFTPDCLFKQCFCQFKLTPLFSLTVLNLVVFFTLLDRKFNEDSKNVLKTVIFLHQVGFSIDFVPDSSQTVFLVVQTLTPLFSMTVPNIVVFLQVFE